MQNELDFTGVEATESRTGSARRINQPSFPKLLWFSFGGGLAANVLFLTFFGIPIAASWYVALLWLCIGWSVLGTGSLTYRTGAALSVLFAGLLPIAPLIWYLSLPHDPRTLSRALLIFMAITIPTYFAFWCDRTFRGRFIKVDSWQAKPDIGLTSSISLRDWFQLTALCSIPLAVIPSSVAYVLQTSMIELFTYAVWVVPSAFLLPLLDLACGSRKSSLFSPFKYLLVLCAAIGIVAVGLFLVLSGDLGTALFAASLPLLGYFSVGGFIVLGLSVLSDQQYRFSRYLLSK